MEVIILNSEYLSYRVKILRIMVFIFWICLYVFVELPHHFSIVTSNLGYHYFILGSLLFLIVFILSYIEVILDYYQEIVLLLFWGIALFQMGHTLLVEASIYNLFWMILFLLIAIKSIFNLKVLFRYSSIYIAVFLFFLMGSSLVLHEKIMMSVIVIVLLILTYLSGYYEKVLSQWNHELYSRHGQILKHANEGFALHEMIFDEFGNPKDYTFVEMNDAFNEITGLGKDIIGRKLSETLPKSEEKWIMKYGEIVKNKKSENFVMKSEGLNKNFIVSAYPFGENGFVTLFLDITEQTKNQERVQVAMDAVQKANISKARFLQDVNHRLRTPLNGMMGMAQLMDLNELSDDNRQLYDAMYLEMKHTRNIINQIAQYVQIEDMDFVITKNSIIQVIEETIESFNVINRKRIVFKIKSCSKEESFFEKSVVQKILVELIDNGLKYSGKMVEVILSDSFNQERNTFFYSIDVIDYGKGISEEKQELIFNELYHHDFVHIYKSDNNISLALCKHLAENIGASLTVESKVSEMTKFTVSIPAFEQD